MQEKLEDSNRLVEEQKLIIIEKDDYIKNLEIKVGIYEKRFRNQHDIIQNDINETLNGSRNK